MDDRGAAHFDPESPNADAQEYEFDVALSSAGEEREYANAVGFKLRNGRTAVPEVTTISGESRLPRRLEAGQGIDFVIDIREITRVHVTAGGLHSALRNDGCR